MFANAFPNNVEKSMKMLKVYYKMKTKVPNFFSNRDVSDRTIQDSLDHQYYVPLPVTPDNCNLIFHRLSSFDPKQYVFDEAVKTFIAVCEIYTFYNGPRSGTIFVFDLAGATAAHMLRPSLASIRKGMKFLQEGCPLNIKAIHVLNTVPFIDKIMSDLNPLRHSSNIFSKLEQYYSNRETTDQS